MSNDIIHVTFIEAVLLRPKMYTFYDGSFAAAISFLEGYYSGKIGGYWSSLQKSGFTGNVVGSEPREYQEWFDFCDWLRRKTEGRFRNGTEIFNAPHEDNAMCFAELLERYHEFRQVPEDEQRGERG